MLLPNFGTSLTIKSEIFTYLTLLTGIIRKMPREVYSF